MTSPKVVLKFYLFFSVSSLLGTRWLLPVIVLLWSLYPFNVFWPSVGYSLITKTSNLHSLSFIWHDTSVCVAILYLLLWWSNRILCIQRLALLVAWSVVWCWFCWFCWLLTLSRWRDCFLKIFWLTIPRSIFRFFFQPGDKRIQCQSVARPQALYLSVQYANSQYQDIVSFQFSKINFSSHC